MKSNPDTVIIRDESTADQVRHVLYVDGAPRAEVTGRGNAVKFRFHPCGAFGYQEARVWLEGLLQLSVIADQLTGKSK